MPTTRGAVLSVHSDRLLDDVALAAELGLSVVRLDVPWATAQPRAGGVDGDVFERLRLVAETARGLGVAPWFRLLQPDVPHWFDDEGGFTDHRTAGTWWPRWVELAADRLGDIAAGWVPIEAPFGMCRRLMPDDPQRHGKVTHHVLVAWRDAWRILRGTAPVATSLDVAIERPIDESPQARAAASRLDQLRWGLWFRGLTDGIVRIPGRADRPLPDLAGSVDIVGVALRRDIETCLYRVGDADLGRPLAVVYRPDGGTDGERTQQVHAMWREVRRAADQLDIASVSITPFVDAPGSPGIVTADREVKDSGHAFAAD